MSQAAGFNIFTFPPLRRSAFAFAPQPPIEAVADRIAATYHAAIQRAADALLQGRRVARQAGEHTAGASASSAVHDAAAGLRESAAVESAAAVATPADLLERADCISEEIDEMRLLFDTQRARSLLTAPRSLEDVLVMAAYLNLPYGGEVGVEHLWIADAALCAQLPLGWAELTDPRSDVRYYLSILTSETMWEHPQVAMLRGAAAAVRDAVAARTEAHKAAREENLGSEA